MTSDSRTDPLRAIHGQLVAIEAVLLKAQQSPQSALPLAPYLDRALGMVRRLEDFIRPMLLEGT